MSRASILRPTDTLRRKADLIIDRRTSGRGLGDPDTVCHLLAEQARQVAVGFYERAALRDPERQRFDFAIGAGP